MLKNPVKYSTAKAEGKKLTEEKMNPMPYLKENILCPKPQSLHCHLWSFRLYKDKMGQTGWNSVVLS